MNWKTKDSLRLYPSTRSGTGHLVFAETLTCGRGCWKMIGRPSRCEKAYSSDISKYISWYVRLSQRWRFKSQSSGLWRRVVSWLHTTSPWRWRQHGPPNRWYPNTWLHGVTTQKTATWNTDFFVCFLFFICEEKCTHYVSPYDRTPQTVHLSFSTYSFGVTRTHIIHLCLFRNFSLRHRVQNSCEAHPASYPMDIGGYFPMDKAVGAWRWPLTFI